MYRAFHLRKKIKEGEKACKRVQNYSTVEQVNREKFRFISHNTKTWGHSMEVKAGRFRIHS